MTTIIHDVFINKDQSFEPQILIPINSLLQPQLFFLSRTRIHEHSFTVKHTGLARHHIFPANVGVYSERDIGSYPLKNEGAVIDRPQRSVWDAFASSMQFNVLPIFLMVMTGLAASICSRSFLKLFIFFSLRKKVYFIDFHTHTRLYLIVLGSMSFWAIEAILRE